MTKEEAFKLAMQACKETWNDKTCKQIKEALEQQPCDDAISRQDTEQMFRNIRSHLKPQDYKSAEEFNTRDLMLLNAEQMIHALPSVTQKSGHWIWSDEIDRYVCDKCGQSDGKDKEMVKSGEYPLSNYCHNCGCRMFEPQESE